MDNRTEIISAESEKQNQSERKTLSETFYIFSITYLLSPSQAGLILMRKYQIWRCLTKQNCLQINSVCVEQKLEMWHENEQQLQFLTPTDKYTQKQWHKYFKLCSSRIPAKLTI